MPRWDDITGEVTGGALRDGSTDRIQPFERNRPYLTVLSGANMGQMFALEGSDKVIGRSHKVEIQLVDEGISRRHAAIRARAKDGNRYWLEDLSSRNGTFCNGQRIREHRLYDGDKIQLGRGVMLRFGYQDQYDESFQRTMQESARRDALTGCYNKRYFNERLESEFGFAQRHDKPLSLILMDLDHFKHINDQHGHVVGDQVLRRFADEVQSGIRNEDVLARYGGEEFAVISRSSTLRDACRIAERLRAAIEALTIDHEGHELRVSVSMGVVSLPAVGVQNPLDFVDAADRALYDAKTQGRNRVAIYRPDLDERPTQLVERETRPPPSSRKTMDQYLDSGPFGPLGPVRVSITPRAPDDADTDAADAHAADGADADADNHGADADNHRADNHRAEADADNHRAEAKPSGDDSAGADSDGQHDDDGSPTT